MKHSIRLTVLLLLVAVAGGWYFANVQRDAPAMADTVASSSAQDAAPRHKRILIVPGHEPHSGGTSFQGLFERDLAVEIAQDLRKYLQADGTFDVIMTRNAAGWNPVFETYFAEKRDDIIAWRDAAKSSMSDRLDAGEVVKPFAPVAHKRADEDVAIELYGINKWASENGVDFTLHLHFNEHRERPSKRPGPNTGFSIYVPAPQFDNSAATKPVAEKLFARLSKYDPVSDLGGEDLGIINESDLIAVGSNNSAKVPSALIEYGYIYEQRFTDPNIRGVVLDDLAYLTALGLRDAFGKSGTSDPFGTTLLPREWKAEMTRKSAAPEELLALQTALAADGSYPPEGKTGNECPRNGAFGDCTAAALAAFQRKYAIDGESGYVGSKTLEKLRELFGEDLQVTSDIANER